MQCAQVLDRVIAKAGGNNWWTTITARAKVQQLVQRYKGGNSLVEAGMQADNYGLCSHTRVALSKCAQVYITPSTQHSPQQEMNYKQPESLPFSPLLSRPAFNSGLYSTVWDPSTHYVLLLQVLHPDRLAARIHCKLKPVVELLKVASPVSVGAND